MFNKIKSIGGRFVAKARGAVEALASKVSDRAEEVLSQTIGEAYVDTGVKILIAVVIGALLLTLLYALFGDTIMPAVTERVQGLFDYAGA